MCSLSPNTMSLGGSENKNMWHEIQESGEWVQRVSAGGSRNNIRKSYYPPSLPCFLLPLPPLPPFILQSPPSLSLSLSLSSPLFPPSLPPSLSHSSHPLHSHPPSFTPSLSPLSPSTPTLHPSLPLSLLSVPPSLPPSLSLSFSLNGFYTFFWHTQQNLLLRPIQGSICCHEKTTLKWLAVSIPLCKFASIFRCQ